VLKLKLRFGSAHVPPHLAFRGCAAAAAAAASLPQQRRAARAIARLLLLLLMVTVSIGAGIAGP
jgi:hypothetical protein